jgi:hypothetical protein
MERHDGSRRDAERIGISSQRPAMVRFAAGAAAALVGVALVSLPQACTKRLPHGGEEPVYPLRGLHAAVPCEGCHGPGTPQKLPNLCIDCHEDDRPDPDHYVAQNCSPCHTEDGWHLVDPTTTRDTAVPPTPTGDTGPTITTPPDPNHEGITPDMLCMLCHEVDRPATPTPGSPTHYYNEVEARRSDCGPCHGLRDWLGESPSGTGAPYEHVTRSPHGTFSDNVENTAAEWVVACAECHPSSAARDYTAYDCQSACHASLITTPPGHYGISEIVPANNELCVACHPTGE